MAGSRSFSIKGVEEVAKALQGLERKISVQAQKAALTAGSDILVKAAKAKAPVSTLGSGRGSTKGKKGKRRHRPGRLQKSIEATIYEGFGGALNSQLKISATKAYAIIRVKDQKGHLLEYGHKTVAGKFRSGKSRHKSKPGAQTFVAPRPFMRPAIDENENKILEAMASEIKKVIDSL